MPDIDFPTLVLSRYQAAPLLQRRGQDDVATASPDLGISEVVVELDDSGVHFPGGERISWDDLRDIAESENGCFRVDGDEVSEIRTFSETTNWVRSLMPTTGAPTMLVSGIPMHRISGIEPRADTLRKIKTIAPLGGLVLDTATGLGYTAIEAAKTAQRVVTIELDPSGLEIARQNPWSRGLFDNPRIEQVIGDTYEIIQSFPDGEFSRVLHDPPAMSLAGDLYSGAFYRQLHRILTRNGRLFHYIGDPESASGRNITRGVIRRLQESGFTRIVRHPEAFGVVAFKG
jgi:predicted methyltransferase